MIVVMMLIMITIYAAIKHTIRGIVVARFRTISHIVALRELASDERNFHRKVLTYQDT